jgi:hypothetical protein
MVGLFFGWRRDQARYHSGSAACPMQIIRMQLERLILDPAVNPSPVAWRRSGRLDDG